MTFAAFSASTGSTSTVVTFRLPRRAASSAAFQPLPVPISNTRCPSATSSAVSMRATIVGMELDEVAMAGPSLCPSSTCVTIGTSR